MNVQHWALLGSWTLFSLLHSGLAAEKFKLLCHAAMGTYAKYYRLLYSVIAFISLGIVMVLQFSISSPVIRILPLYKWLVGLPTEILGITLMVASIRKYFFNFSGIGAFFHDKEAAILETGGLNKHMRHPLYAGTLLSIWALFLFFPLLRNLLACAAITTYVLVGIRLEEQKLLLIYGDAYRVYRLKTPMLIPFGSWELNK